MYSDTGKVSKVDEKGDGNSSVLHGTYCSEGDSGAPMRIVESGEVIGVHTGFSKN